MKLESLVKIGLTSGEARVYLALLKAGSTTTGELIKKSGVSRSKLYDVLERLKNKGLSTEIISKGVRHFEATEPSRIKDLLEKKKIAIEEDIIESKKMIAELNSLKSNSLEKQEARVYTGIGGIKTLYEEIILSMDKNSEYLAFGIDPEDAGNEKVRDFFRKFHLNRAEKKVKARIIMRVETKKEMKDFEDLKFYQYRFSKVSFPTNIALHKDTLIILVWGNNPIAFAITSKQISSKYRAYFEELWGSVRD